MLESFGASADHADTALPEPLGVDAYKLCLCDAVTAVVLIVLSFAFGVERAAALAVFVTLGVGFGLGRYRSTFAVVPKDEWYAAISMAVASAAALLLLVPLFDVQWYGAASAVVLAAVSAGATATALTQRRRGGQPLVRATRSRSGAIDRKHVRNPLRQGCIAAIDFVLGAMLLIVLIPVIALCALAILVDDGAPVLFAQRRTGIDGGEFVMYKFRTMHVEADGRWASERDERITRVGRFLRRTSLDELPQLWNVLRGEMSLVGPRPEMCEYTNRFSSVVPAYQERHVVRPGITGWAQVNYDRNFPPSEFTSVLAYDLFYVANYSVRLYLLCLVKTACEVMNHRAL